MSRVAERFATTGWTLRSGGADGADSAFESGARRTDAPSLRIYIPWEGFNGRRSDGSAIMTPGRNIAERAQEIASQHHTGWGRLGFGAKLLHARNTLQVLGEDLASPSDFVLCWTPKGKGGGGTGQALRIAKACGIGTWDLGDPDTLAVVREWMGMAT
jgi:hypothetical protein